MTTDTDQMMDLPIEKVLPNPDNLRQKIDGNVLKELTKSIESSGILNPLLVRPDPTSTDGGGFMQVIAGHRRLEAARKAGLETVPVIVRELTDEQAYESMLIENLQRVDLTPAEEARGYFRLVERGMTQKELARRIGRSQKHVSSRLKLLDLPDATLEAVGVTLHLDRAQQWAEAFASNDWQLILDRADDNDDIAAERDRVLEASTGERGFAHPGMIETVADKIRRADVVDKVRAKAADKGFDLVEMEYKNTGTWGWPAGHVELADMALPAKEHRKESCHAIGLKTHEGYGGRITPKAVEICTRRSRHNKSGASPVKPSDIDQREAEKAAEKERRDAEKHRRAEWLATLGRTVKGTKKAPATDLVASHLCVEAIHANDDTCKRLLAVLEIDASAAKSALDRSELLEVYATKSSAARLRLAEAYVLLFSSGYGAAVTIGLPDLVDELVEPHMTEEQRRRHEEQAARRRKREEEMEAAQRKRDEAMAERRRIEEATCDQCSGTGLDDDEATCDQCGGTGIDEDADAEE